MNQQNLVMLVQFVSVHIMLTYCIGDKHPHLRMSADDSRNKAFHVYQSLGGTGGKRLFYQQCEANHLLRDHHAGFDNFSCTHCQASASRLADLNRRLKSADYSDSEKEEFRFEIFQLTFHIDRWKHQRSSLRHIIEGLTYDQVCFLSFGFEVVLMLN